MAEDAVTIDNEGSMESKRRFNIRDFDYIAEYVLDEFNTRKRKRKDLEKQWDEIDRQVAMIPDIQFKKLSNGEIDARKMWMSEMELPLQAQALEVLTADARRMMFPDSGPWFRAHAEVTDEYLERVDFSSLILGDELEVPSQINQDNADKLVEGFLLHLFGQYDLQTRLDRINAESFRYGMGIGRARMETKSVFIHEARGVRRADQKIPVLVPASVRNHYLEEPMPSMHSSQVLGEAHIAVDWMKLENLQIAANRGSNDPQDQDGGWMPSGVRRLEPDKNGYVQLLEMEGDIVIPRKTVRSMVIPGVIVTVAVGSEVDGKATRSVVRLRFRKLPTSSYLLFPYHYESACDTYPTSPLMKGRTVQIMAVQALNRLLDSAALKNSPPIGYDKSDMSIGSGPNIHPYALWPVIDPQAIKVFSDVGGDPVALANMFSQAIQFYAELTGILPARLGAQTVSHTTAFAKDAELQRGAVRTVDYVRQAGMGPMTKWLDLSYRMGREAIGNQDISFFIEAYGGFVKLGKDKLPEKSIFDWFGAGGPAEEQQKRQTKLNSLALAMQMEQLGAAFGQEPTLDLAAAKREVLREGGWTDVDTITRAAEPPRGASPASGVPGASGAGVPAALASIPQLLG